MEKQLFCMMDLQAPWLRLSREAETDRQQRTRLPLFSYDSDQLASQFTKLNISVFSIKYKMRGRKFWELKKFRIVLLIPRGDRWLMSLSTQCWSASFKEKSWVWVKTFREIDKIFTYPTQQPTKTCSCITMLWMSVCNVFMLLLRESSRHF